MGIPVEIGPRPNINKNGNPINTYWILNGPKGWAPSYDQVPPSFTRNDGMMNSKLYVCYFRFPQNTLSLNSQK